MLNSMYDEHGNPFGVLCTNPDCAYYEGRPEIDPLWTEDCLYRNGTVICPQCLSPVKRPEPLPEAVDAGNAGA